MQQLPCGGPAPIDFFAFQASSQLTSLTSSWETAGGDLQGNLAVLHTWDLPEKMQDITGEVCAREWGFTRVSRETEYGSLEPLVVSQSKGAFSYSGNDQEPIWVTEHLCAGLNFGATVSFCHSLDMLDDMFNQLTQLKTTWLVSGFLMFFWILPRKACGPWPGYRRQLEAWCLQRRDQNNLVKGAEDTSVGSRLIRPRTVGDDQQPARRR